MEHVLDEKLGAFFPPTSRFVGQITFVAGMIAAVFTPIVGLFFASAGAFVGFSKSGVLLNPGNKTYKYYIGLFGLRFGKFQSYEQFPYLSVLRTKVTSSAFSITNRNAVTGTNLYFDVYFLNQSHRERVLIRRYSSQFEAKENAQELGVLLSKEVVMYSPKVSAETQRRR